MVAQSKDVFTFHASWSEMTNFVRNILLIVFGVLAGYVAGRLVPIPAALLFHVSSVQQTWAGIIGAVAGGLAAWVRITRLNGSGQFSQVHGSARFVVPDALRRTMAIEAGLVVGRENRKGGKLLRYAGDAHLITIAPTRSGKGVGAVIPNLLTADRAVLCIDPKGENARLTARARRRFGPVYVLDPFEVSSEPTACFNPLAGLDPESPDLGQDVDLIAEALVTDPPGQSGEVHWNEEARALIAGVILYVVCETPPYQRNLGTVRQHLTGSPQETEALLHRMQQSSGADGLIRRAANRHLAKSDREAAGVLSTAQRHTHFLDSPRIVASMSQSDFRFEDLKASSATVYLVLPPDRLDANARWLRLMVALGLQALARAPSRPVQPVLFLLDEFAALGRLAVVERGFGLMAGYGVQLWPILQDLNQLKSAYGRSAGTFLANAGLIQIFNVSDLETAQWVSGSLGTGTISYQTTGSSRSQGVRSLLGSTSNSTSGHLVRRELMTPDEVMRLGPDLALLLRQGQEPALVRKIRYYSDTDFSTFR
jgi:type IV secretion system protein VirD4